MPSFGTAEDRGLTYMIMYKISITTCLKKCGERREVARDRLSAIVVVMTKLIPQTFVKGHDALFVMNRNSL